MLHTASTLRFLSVLFLFLGIASCNEDTIEPTGEGSISGVVIDSETGDPIVAASISTNPATSAIITDAEGKFMLNAITDGSYSITASKTGYKTETVSVAVKNGKETAATIVMEASEEGNSAPNPASDPEPAIDADNISNTVTLKWSSTDPDKNDSLTYDVYLLESGAAQKKRIAESIKDTSVVATDLKYNTTYFWQVVSKDKRGNVTNGEVWSFRTGTLPELRYLFTRVVEGNYDIYYSDGVEANTIRLTNAFSRELWPVLNNTRTKIAYSSNAGIETQIYTMNRDGSDKRQITMLPVAGYHNPGIGFTWSPDGGTILYPHYDDLYLVDQNGTNLRLLAKAPANRHFHTADWIAQGNKIIFQTMGANINDSEIYMMNSDGTNRMLLVENKPGRLGSPSLSVTGREILYTHDVSGFESPEGRQLDARIFLEKIDGTGIIDLSSSKPAGTNDLYPRFSPDGAKVIFVNVSNDGTGPKEVWMVEIGDAKKRTKLLSDADMPHWK